MLPGINDMYDVRKWTAQQEEAWSYKFGDAGTVAGALIYLFKEGIIQPGSAAKISAKDAAEATSTVFEEIDFWSKKNEDTTKTFFAHLFLHNIGYKDSMRDVALKTFEKAFGVNIHEFMQHSVREDDHFNLLGLLWAHAQEIKTQGVAMSFDHKRSKIVGRSMNNAAPADTWDVLWGHFAI
jgi:hypothetical protein